MAVDAPEPGVLREYALLADGERGVLVGPRGEFAWMPFPRWHDDALFSSLLGGHSFYSVRPVGRFVWGGYYEPGSLVWRSRWVTEDGIVECREALAVPADEERAVLLRRAVAVRGQARMRVLLRPGAEFDRHGMARLRRDDDGCWSARVGGAGVRWSGAAGAEPLKEGRHPKALAMEFQLEPGESRDFVLWLGQGGLEETNEQPEQLWKATAEWWRERVGDFDRTSAPRDARHAYAVMTGLTSARGGMVAAATTSLPERAEQGRNYDYRYVWMRDQCYAGHAVARAGAQPLLDRTLGFVTERLLADGPDVCPAYTVTGERVPKERGLGLPGYPGGGDVAGNQVRHQFQPDVFGEALLLFAAAAEHDRLDGTHWRAAEIAAAAIGARRRRGSGSWSRAAGLTAVWPAPPGCGLSPPRRRGGRCGRAGSLSPTTSSPRRAGGDCTRRDAGSAPRTTSASTPPSSWPLFAAPSRPTIRARWPRSPRSKGS